jgi:hypothetical protein
MKSVKSYLKMCLEIAHCNRDDLKGISKLSESEYMLLGDIRAEIQNELCENQELLEKYKLRYNAGG